MSTGSLPSVPSADNLHLKLIAIFHYVMCGMAIFGLIFLGLHYAIMSTAFSDPHMWEKANPPPPFDPTKFFQAFVWFYILMGAWGVVSLVLNLISGICIQTRRARLFSLVVAGINCINFPFGTALGVCTFIVLLRPSMPMAYRRSAGL
jgi:hypothetical protein